MLGLIQLALESARPAQSACYLLSLSEHTFRQTRLLLIACTPEESFWHTFSQFVHAAARPCRRPFLPPPALVHACVCGTLTCPAVSQAHQLYTQRCAEFAALREYGGDRAPHYDLQYAEK